jgi:hypothetical protein
MPEYPQTQGGAVNAREADMRALGEVVLVAWIIVGLWLIVLYWR